MSKKLKKLQPKHLFLRRFVKNASMGLIAIFLSLAIGMLGYRYFENMPWVDSFENASMILSGMGPVTDMHTEDGKLFAGFYALFSGTVFLLAIATIFMPIFHRFLHKYLLEES